MATALNDLLLTLASGGADVMRKRGLLHAVELLVFPVELLGAAEGATGCCPRTAGSSLWEVLPLHFQDVVKPVAPEDFRGRICAPGLVGRPGGVPMNVTRISKRPWPRPGVERVEGAVDLGGTTVTG